jgi:capping protein alpha
VSEFNKLEDNRYFDVESQTSFEVDHITQVRTAGLRRSGIGASRADSAWLGVGSICGAIICPGVAECRFDVSGVVAMKLLGFLANVPFRKSLLKAVSAHASEHYPSSSYGVYPTADDSAVAILLVANRYSPNNFWYVGS